MRKIPSLGTPSKFALIAWILIGLMVGGPLVDYLVTRHLSDVCAETRVLEHEDDRADILDVVFVPTHWTWSLAAPTETGEAPQCPHEDFWLVHPSMQFVRGPPQC